MSHTLPTGVGCAYVFLPGADSHSACHGILGMHAATPGSTASTRLSPRKWDFPGFKVQRNLTHPGIWVAQANPSQALSRRMKGCAFTVSVEHAGLALVLPHVSLHPPRTGKGRDFTRSQETFVPTVEPVDSGKFIPLRFSGSSQEKPSARNPEGRRPVKKSLGTPVGFRQKRK